MYGFFTFLIITSASLVILTLGEFLYSLKRQDGQYSVQGTLGNILCNMVTRLIQRFLNSLHSTYVLLALIGFGYQNQQLDGLSVVVSLVLIDLTYYFVHSTHHRTSFLWMFHAVHHGDNKFNLSTGMRVGWIQELYFTPVLILPAVLIGFSPSAVATALLIIFYTTRPLFIWCISLGQVCWKTCSLLLAPIASITTKPNNISVPIFLGDIKYLGSPFWYLHIRN